MRKIVLAIIAMMAISAMAVAQDKGAEVYKDGTCTNMAPGYSCTGTWKGVETPSGDATVKCTCTVDNPPAEDIRIEPVACIYPEVYDGAMDGWIVVTENGKMMSTCHFNGADKIVQLSSQNFYIFELQDCIYSLGIQSCHAKEMDWAYKQTTEKGI